MTSKMLEITDVAAGYDGKNVIADVNFHIERGETFGLVGLNGAGKTTLIKTILGLKNQSSGTITVDGQPGGSDAAKKQIAYLPERFDPAWFLNAYEFIDFTLSLYKNKIGKAEVNAMADGMGLKTSFLAKRAQTYSKGMRQKLGLITTMLTGCPFLILDEPMSGLDPLARAQVKELLAKAKTEGRTIFICSHIMSDLEELCARIAVVHEGRIVFIGKPAELLAQTGQSHLERAFLSLVTKMEARAA